MPRANKATIDVAVEASEEEVMVQPKRSTRKRRAINYAEPQAEDSDWVEKTPKKMKKKLRTVVTETVTETVQTTAPGASYAPIEVGSSPPPAPKPKPKKRAKKARDDEIEYDEDGEEIRKREYQVVPPEHFHSKVARAISQPIQVVGRERVDSDDAPQEKFIMTGSEGRRYEVDIKLVPKCTCPDFLFRRKSCKHIIYVLHLALKVPEDSELLYQLAFTSAELHQILNEETTAPVAAPEDMYRDGKRKQMEGEECPICYMDFDPTKEAVSYCKAACGNNIHTKCIQIWLRSQSSDYGKATCPLCRAPWTN